MVTKLGHPTTLTTAEEETLVNYVKLMAEIGYPLTRKALSNEVERIIKLDGRKTPFKNDKPG